MIHGVFLERKELQPSATRERWIDYAYSVEWREAINLLSHLSTQKKNNLHLMKYGCGTLTTTGAKEIYVQMSLMHKRDCTWCIYISRPIFLVSLTSCSCFLLPSPHHSRTDSPFFIFWSDPFVPRCRSIARYSFTLHLVEERRQQYFFTLWLWVKYDFNYHENVLYYQWEDENRLRKLWDALTDDNGQVSMQAAVLGENDRFFTVWQKLRGKGGGSTCKADSTDPDICFKKRLFASIHGEFF